MTEGQDEPSTTDCVDRKLGAICETCGAVIGPVIDFLPGACLDLEAREDRARDICPRHREAMEQAGGSIADKMARMRTKQE